MQNASKYRNCRICRTEANLKFTATELIKWNAKKCPIKYDNSNQCNNFYSKQITQLLGNICHDCERRLQMYQQDGDDMQTDEELEIDVVNCENANFASATLLKERLTNDLRNHISSNPKTYMPIIVNEADERNLIYNLFVMGKLKENQQQLQQHFAETMKANLTPYNNSNANKQMLNGLIAEGSILLEKPTSESKVKGEDYRIVAVIDLDDNEESMLNCQEISNTANSEVAVVNSPDMSCNGDHVVHYNPIDNGVADDEDDIFSCKDMGKFEHNKIESAKHSNDNKMRLMTSLNLVSSDSDTENNNQQKENEELPTSILSTASNTQKRRSHRIYTYKHCQQTTTDPAESFKSREHKHSLIKCPVCEIEFSVIRRLLHHMRYKHRDYNGHVLVEKPRLSQDSSMTIRLRYMRRTTYYECQLCGHIDEMYKEHKNHILEKHPIESKCLKDPFIKQLKCPVCETECGPKYLNLCRHILNKHEPQQYKSYLKQVASIGGNSGNKESIQTAIIYQYTKFKAKFFECKFCHKIVDGYQHHLRHLKKHKDALALININKSKPAKKLASLPKPPSNSKDSTKGTKAKTKTKSAEITLKKAKEKQVAEVANGKMSNKKRRSHLKEVSALSNLKIVKVKPPLKQVSMQTYECRYCSKSFMGFRVFNLHLLQQHAHHEFNSCKLCDKSFLTLNALQNHQVKCEKDAINKFKSKRKRIVICKHHFN